jgi:antitoxin component of MazEF toxin-antitoxin module
LAITLPRSYVDAHGLRPRDIVEVHFNAVIHIVPVKKEDILKKVKESP